MISCLVVIWDAPARASSWMMARWAHHSKVMSVVCVCVCASSWRIARSAHHSKVMSVLCVCVFVQVRGGLLARLITARPPLWEKKILSVFLVYLLY
jgi:hypothetical protein